MNLPPNLPPPPGYVPPAMQLVQQLTAPVTLNVPVVAVGKRRINVRAKGQRGEREVISILQMVVDDTRKAHNLPLLLLQRNTLQAHTGGHDIVGFDGYSFEVKFQECDYNAAWWAQCLKQAAKCNAVPILLYRKSKQKWTVKFRAYVNTPRDRDQVEVDITTTLEDFLSWFESAYDETCSHTQ